MSDKSIKPVRRPQNQTFMGVCSGLADYVNIDPFWVRAAFVALSLASGAGLALYFVLMLLMPAPEDYDAPWSETVAHNFRQFLLQFQRQLFRLYKDGIGAQSVAGWFVIGLGVYLIFATWGIIAKLAWPLLIIIGLYLVLKQKS